MLRVVGGGDPSAEELAAVVVALAAISRESAPAPAVRSAWADRAQLLRRPFRHGPGMWRRGG